MWGASPIMNPQAGKDKNKLIAVAIDKDRGSQMALKWSIENIVAKGHTILLVHVKLTQSNNLSLSLMWIYECLITEYNVYMQCGVMSYCIHSRIMIEEGC